MILRRIREALRKISFLRTIYHKLFYPKGYCENYYYNPEIPEVTPYHPRKYDSVGMNNEVRLNLLIPTIDRRHVFGGISTAMNFYKGLAQEMQISQRIIITDEMNPDTSLEGYEEYSLVKPGDESSERYQLLPYNQRYNVTFPVSKGDIFVATAWWTAYCIFPVLKWQSETYNIPLNKLIYFVQDFEPGFYQWSSRFAYAESTYRSDYPVISVFNTKLLMNYFEEHHYEFFRKYYFEPSLNNKLYQYLQNNNQLRKKKQIFIYGRPSVARNAFELIVEALKRWAELQPDAHEWIVYSAGEKHLNIDLPGGTRIVSLGKLTLGEYAKTLAETYAGISIMISPHPSYPPLEMSTFGVKTITNCFENKDLASFNEQIISLKSYAPDDIAQKLLEICSSYDLDHLFVFDKEKNMHYLNHEDTFTEINQQIRDLLL